MPVHSEDRGYLRKQIREGRLFADSNGMVSFATVRAAVISVSQ